MQRNLALDSFQSYLQSESLQFPSLIQPSRKNHPRFKEMITNSARNIDILSFIFVCVCITLWHPTVSCWNQTNHIFWKLWRPLEEEDVNRRISTVYYGLPSKVYCGPPSKVYYGLPSKVYCGLPSRVGCSSKQLFLNFVPVSGYMVRLGEWSPQKKFQRYRQWNDPLPATWSFQW